VQVATSSSDVAILAANVVDRLIREVPTAVLALPTGRTPVELYRELVRRTSSGAIDWRGVRAFNLDEWVGVPADSAASYARFMLEHLYAHVNLPPSQRFIPSGMATDLARECRAYEEAIELVGGIDLAILGLGTNGHIGFNEPGTLFDVRTHVADVAEETRVANSYTFPPGQTPKQAITVGIATILDARQVLLLVTGSEKAEILRRAVAGPVDPVVPASALQRHPRVTIIGDPSAVGPLPERLREGQPSGCA
jgi:glucosamine-6-phosphate deaminase